MSPPQSLAQAKNTDQTKYYTIAARMHWLTNLEQVLLVIQAFLLLVSKLGQRVVESIIINQLVVTFRDCLSDDFQNALELLDRTNHARLDELKLRCYDRTEFIQVLGIRRSVGDRGGCIGVFAA